MLKLNRPLAFFDIESTGLDIINDKIIEISILKIYNDKKEKINTFRINPGIPIPPESSEIHGIFDRDVKKCPKFYELGEIINNPSLGRKTENDITVCDLTGTGVQDTAIARYAFDLAKSKNLGMEIN